MKNNSIKNIILTLLRSISSEKEIRKYIEKFSNVDHRYIIIKVGGAIIQNDLDMGPLYFFKYPQNIPKIPRK